MIQLLDLNAPWAPPSPPAPPLQIRAGKHLFINEQIIESSHSLFCRVNQPHKAGRELLYPERNYEGQCICFGTVLEMEDGSCRMYYRGWSQEEAAPELPFHIDCANFQKRHGYSRGPICIAAAEKESLRRIDSDDAAIPGTNVILDEPVLDDFCILRDPTAEDPAEQYKMLAAFDNIPGGLSAAVSPDALHWTWKRKNAVSYFGDRCSFWFNPLSKTFVAWSRALQIYLARRWIFQHETKIFPEWHCEDADPQRYVGYSENLRSTPQLVFAPDSEDSPDLQFYSGYPFFWGNMFLAYLECYHVERQKIDVQLGGSYDGVTWFRIGNRETFLPCGNHGDFDAYWVVPTYNVPILRDGKIWLYYNGRSDPHRAPGFRHVAPGMQGGFSVATLREDGFVSLDATGEPGRLRTRLLELPKPLKRFALNCMPFREHNPEMPMRVRIRVLDENGCAAAGWELTEDDGRVIWHEFPVTCPFPSHFRLEMEVQNCRLYSMILEV